jgi:dienelactone hydrolase
MFNPAFVTRRWFLALSFGSACNAAAATIDEEIRALAGQAPLAMQFAGGGADACRAWQRAFAAKLGELLGPYQPPARWETQRERTVELADHTREELILRAPGCRDLPVYVLVPRKAPRKRPGILALHGHGEYGYDAVAGIDTTPERKTEIDELRYDYGRRLAQRGYLVTIPCFTPFGRRLGERKQYQGEDPCGVTFIRMQLLGRLLIAENLRDALWALELLARREDVDASRLGCVGLSYGGRMAMLASALSAKIRVSVISGALNVMQERVLGRYSCGAQIIPGLLRYGDVPEIASLIAPRPCLWEVGQHDSLMVKSWIGPALHRMRRAWSAFHAVDQLSVDSFPGKHRWNGEKAYPLLDQVLMS